MGRIEFSNDPKSQPKEKIKKENNNSSHNFIGEYLFSCWLFVNSH